MLRRLLVASAAVAFAVPALVLPALAQETVRVRGTEIGRAHV